MTNELKPWWHPVLCDKEYFDRLRKDYPENTSMSDKELHDYYDHSRKYSVTWDHVGDAYAEYEKLADAYLELSSPWISCKERLPDPHTWVFGAMEVFGTGEGHSDVVYHVERGEFFSLSDNLLDGITHWQELTSPSPPGE